MRAVVGHYGFVFRAALESQVSQSSRGWDSALKPFRLDGWLDAGDIGRIQCLSEARRVVATARRR